MISFEIERFSRASVPVMWGVFTDWDALASIFPWTMTITDEGEPGVGWSFTARTKAGLIKVDDPMTITRWTPPSNGGPATYSVRKIGDRVKGWADVQLTPHPKGSRLLWREEITVPSILGRTGQRMADAANERIFRRAIDRLIDIAEERARSDKPAGDGEPAGDSKPAGDRDRARDGERAGDRERGTAR